MPENVISLALNALCYGVQAIGVLQWTSYWVICYKLETYRLLSHAFAVHLFHPENHEFRLTVPFPLFTLGNGRVNKVVCDTQTWCIYVIACSYCRERPVFWITNFVNFLSLDVRLNHSVKSCTIVVVVVICRFTGTWILGTVLKYL